MSLVWVSIFVHFAFTQQFYGIDKNIYDINKLKLIANGLVISHIIIIFFILLTYCLALFGLSQIVAKASQNKLDFDEIFTLASDGSSQIRPNQTVPYQTKPNLTKLNCKSSLKQPKKLDFDETFIVIFDGCCLKPNFIILNQL